MMLEEIIDMDEMRDDIRDAFMHDKIVFPMLSYLTLLLYTGEPLSNKVFWFVTMFVSSHNSFQSLRSPLSGPEWGLFLVLLQPIFSKFINNIT